METDIRVIRLYRKALGDANGGTSAAQSADSYFATDYFDLMDVEKKELKDGLAAIMGLEHAGNDNNRGTAMQSYTLYCSEEMINSYETNSGYLGDPFQADSNVMPFLSVIQVHITPEALKRIDFDEIELWKQEGAEENGIILEPFVKDLYDIIRHYAGGSQKRKYICRVYHVLSAGDFAVVVRSQDASTSYDISTMIRKQTLTAGKNWVIYKTYTLLTMQSYILPDAGGYGGQVGSKFVIRGCYSNKYWSEQEKVKKELENLGLTQIDGLFRLNGRYDFSIRIEENDFVELFPRIMNYKGVSNHASVQNKKREVKIGNTSAINYLKYMMDNNYLSYVNERYLLQDFNLKRELLNVTNVSESLKADQNKTNDPEIKDQIAEEIKTLIKKHEKLMNQIEGLKSYRSSVYQYMQLLKKQIMLCLSINELSDTRIYARVLTEQLESVLASVEIYLELAGKESDTYTIWSLMEEYLAEAVYVLDHYAQYIRNNNLQSLQTPNYNIESSVGMEKILIGYSEFLYAFVNFYKNFKVNGFGDFSKNLLPVVVPDIRHVGVYVEVLFPEGNGSDWKREYNIIQQFKQEKGKDYAFLTSVGCPTFAQLVDIPSMFATLFHEVAHQLRYETRAQRNNSLLRTAIGKCIAETTGNIEKYLNGGFKRRIDLYALMTATAGAAADAIVEVFFKAPQSEEYSYAYQDAPLNSFTYELSSQVESIVLRLQYSVGWQQELQNFLHEILFDNTWDDAIFTDIVELMTINWDRLMSVCPITGDFYSEIDLIEKKEIKCSFLLALLGTYNTLNCEEKDVVKKRMPLLQNNEEIKEWINSDKHLISLDGLEPMWREIFKGIETPALQKNFQAFYRFCIWLDNDIQLSCVICNDKEQLDTVYTKMYHKSCEKWKEYEQKSKLMYLGGSESSEDSVGDYETPTFARWMKTGRGLGIDNETKENCEKFSRIIALSLEVCKEQASDQILKYREETSDIFMCSIVPLTPFGYVNLMAVNLPMDEMFQNAYYDDVYIERIAHVLYEKWCGGSKAQEPVNSYRVYCMEILKRLSNYCEPCMESHPEDTEDNREAREKLREKLKDISILNWEDGGEIIKIGLAHSIECVVGCLQKLRDTILPGGSEADYKKKLLENAVRICKIMEGLIDRGLVYIDKLRSDRELEEDYARGVETLGKLGEEEKTVNGAGREFMFSLTALNKEIAAYFNAEADSKDTFRNLTKIGLEFLVRMFYNNKIRNSKK